MRFYYFLILVLAFFLFSCQFNRSSKEEQSKVGFLKDITFNLDKDSVNYDAMPRLTKEEFDSLQIKKIQYLENTDIAYLSMGEVLYSGDKGKIITLWVLSEGETIEYLLSYNKEGNLLDNAMVAYEDIVEYYSKTYSQIKSDQLTITTITFSYEGVDDVVEKSDTSVVKYRITPDFKFLKD